MSNDTVIAFPGRDFDTWFSWVECELSILGLALSDAKFDWRAAFDRGLKPERAAADAADCVPATA